MDKVKLIGKFIKKYLFWFISITCLLLACVIWKVTDAGMASDYAANMAKNEESFQKMSSLAGTADQANETVVAKKETVVKDQSQNILDAWDKLYLGQREKNVWPITRSNNEEMIAAFESWDEPGFKLDKKERQFYRDYIRDEYLDFLKENYQIVRLNEEAKKRLKSGTADLPAGAMVPGAGGAGDLIDGAFRKGDYDGIVRWDDGNYNMMVKRVSLKGTPTTREVLIAQEDLWVYESILAIIKNLNEGKNEYTANVKEIRGIYIAQDTFEYFLDSEDRVLKLSTQKKGEEGEMSTDVPTTETLEGAEEEEIDEKEEEYAKMFDNRYVDAGGKHILAAQYKEMGNAQYKRMPVQIIVRVKQREVSNFLLGCVNSYMPIEIVRVSVNPDRAVMLDLDESDKKSEGRRTSSKSTSRGSMRGEKGSRGSRSSRDADVSTTTSQDDAEMYGRENVSVDGRLVEEDPEEVELEVLGMVYIYNPPKLELFPALMESEEESEEGEEGEEAIEGETAEDAELVEDEETAEDEETTEDEETAESSEDTESVAEDPVEDVEEQSAKKSTAKKSSAKKKNPPVEEEAPAETEEVEEVEVEEVAEEPENTEDVVEEEETEEE